jgi:prophage regulatory protein
MQPVERSINTLANESEIKPRRLISIQEVLYRTGLSRTAVYQRMGDGLFPAPIELGRNSVWLESDIDAWIDALLAARDSKNQKASYLGELRSNSPPQARHQCRLPACRPIIASTADQAHHTTWPA